MTFRQFLEDFGPLGNTEPGGWPDERKNGVEFARRKIRSKVQIPDGDILPEKRLMKKSPEEIMGRKG